MPRRDNKQVIIVGAGPGGLSTAIALQQVGVDTLVVERAAGLNRTGSGLTLWPNAMKALDRLGLLQAVSRVSRPLSSIAMRTWRGRQLFQMSLASPGEDSSHGVGSGLLRSELTATLARRIDQDRFRFGQTVIGFLQNESGVTAVLDDGNELYGDILIGADGAGSIIREQLFGQSRFHYAGYTVWRGIADFAPQELMGITWMGHGSQFGLFPLTRNRSYWFASAKCSAGDQDSSRGKKSEVLGRFSSWAAPISEVIEVTGDATILRNDVYERQPLNRWGKDCVTLVGDAAHPAAPTLGQGACLAIEDAVVLAACLAAEDDTVTALASYERRRVRRANEMTIQARRIGQIGLWESPTACWLRDRLIMAVPEPVRRRQLNQMFRFEAEPRNSTMKR